MGALFLSQGLQEGNLYFCPSCKQGKGLLYH